MGQVKAVCRKTRRSLEFRLLTVSSSDLVLKPAHKCLKQESWGRAVSRTVPEGSELEVYQMCSLRGPTLTCMSIYRNVATEGTRL